MSDFDSIRFDIQRDIENLIDRINKCDPLICDEDWFNITYEYDFGLLEFIFNNIYEENMLEIVKDLICKEHKRLFMQGKIKPVIDPVTGYPASIDFEKIVDSYADKRRELLVAIRDEKETRKRYAQTLMKEINTKIKSITDEEHNEIFDDDEEETTEDKVESNEYIVELEQRIKKLAVELERVKAENEHLKAEIEKQEEDNKQLRELPKATLPGEEIDSLRNDLLAFQTMDKKGNTSPMFTSKQMSIFLKAILLKLNSLTNNVKTLAPLLQKFGGWTADTANNALGYRVTQKECDELGRMFRPYAPAISKIITDFPKEYDNLKVQKLSANLKK